MKRRQLLAATALALPFAACATATSTPTVTPADIIATGSTVVTGLANAFTQFTADFPTAIPAPTSAAIQGDLALAESAAAALVANVPATTGAATLRTVLGYVNDALNILSASPVNGLIPSPFNVAIAAAATLAPVLEAWAQSVVPAAASPTVAAARVKMRAVAPAMTTTQALTELKKYAN